MKGNAMLKRVLVGGSIVASLITVALHAQPTAPATRPTTGPAATQPAGKGTVTKAGLKIIETAAGDPGAKAGDVVWEHYTGTLKGGKKFESSLGRGEPIRFVLGKGQGIMGCGEGVT